MSEQGNGRGFVASILDLSERKRADEALRESEELNRAILSSLDTHVAVLDRQGKIIAVNSAWNDFARENGVRDEHRVGAGLNYLDVCRKAVRSADVELQKALDGIKAVCEGSKEYFRMEYPCHSPTRQRWFLMLVTPLKRSEGGAVVAHNDITKRKRAEEELRASKERFQRLVETTNAIAWEADLETWVFTYVSPQVTKLLGYESAEWYKTDFWIKHLHPEDRNFAVNLCAESSRHLTEYEFEYRMIAADGHTVWLRDLVTVVSGSNGQKSLRGYLIDITERKRADEALREAHEQLRKLKDQLEAENIYLQEELRGDPKVGDIVGQSDAITEVLHHVNVVAPTEATVLITGETGTGKELVARAIHAASSRRDRPLIRVNCGALPTSLIENELFGHEKGAFTGAVSQKAGRFELANGGTIFLDEIGELPLESQVKLLRVIQEGEFERVGGTKTIKVDVRIIAATNRNLKVTVDNGNFREDLWYRLNVFPITVPPLRHRREDIPLLTEHFVRTFAHKFGKNIKGIAPATVKALREYSWRGNVRELANVLERAVINTNGPVLRVRENLELVELETRRSSTKTLTEAERDNIVGVLEDCGWRVEGPHGAARILGINPSTLRSKMSKLGIKRITNTEDTD